MYGQYFNIDESVFSIAPNPKYLFLSKQHEEALAHLLYGVTRKGGFVCLTGDIGTGKTTICRCMFEQLPEKTDVAFVINPNLSPVELLASICEELNINISSIQQSVKEYVKIINDYLIKSHAQGRSTVLVIDEAQNLSVDAMEHIRALTNLETNELKLLQIILIGQPELKTLLAKPELEQVNQRITARFHIGPLSMAETDYYINHRLVVAGAKHKIFTKDNIKQIYSLTRGVPRLINILCDRVLLGAYTLGTASITKKIIKQSANEVFNQSSASVGMLPKALAASLLAFLISAAVVISLKDVNIGLSKKDTIAKVDATVTDNQLVSDESIKRSSKGELAKHEKKQEVVNLEKEDTNNNTLSKKVIDQSKVSETPASYVANKVKKEIAKEPQVSKQLSLKNNLPKSEAQNNELQLSSYGKAYKQLFRAWGVEYSSDDSIPCEHALKNQLHCYQSTGNIKNVVALNRPVLLRSKEKRFGPSFIVLVSIEGEHAVVNEGGDFQLAAIKEIESNWDGYFEMLWRPLHTGVRFIKPGYKGEAVAVLDKTIAKLQGRDPSSKNPFEYSKELVDQVRAFQIANNIPADGVVGPITQMHFNNVANDTPFLVGK